MLKPELRALRAALLLAIGVLPAACVDGGKDGPAGSCEGSTAILDADGAATGYERCDDGTIHRVTAVATSSEIEGESCRGTEEYRSCDTDADCTGGPIARCLHDDYVELGGRLVPDADTGSPGDDGCFCAYSCASDADCDEGEACVPAGIVDKDGTWATCVPAECQTDVECTSGECGISSFHDGCSYQTHLTCRDDDDACRTDEECTEGTCAVSYGEYTYECQTVECAIGRPLLVEGEARRAPATARQDWAQDLEIAGIEALSSELAHGLAAWWREVAAMEHASVASFARFSLELLSLGAPPELLMAAQRAAADEIEHARVAFGLASAYAGEAVGPGPLQLDRVLLETDPAAILAALIEEACVGETLGAAEARAAAAEAVDPTVRAALERVADDETRHAALAWRALRWMLDRDATLRPLAEQTFRAAAARARARGLVSSPDAPGHGVLGPEARRRVHLETLAAVVDPCVRQVMMSR